MLHDVKYIDYIKCHHLDYYTLAKFSLLDALQLNPSGKPVAGVNFNKEIQGNHHTKSTNTDSKKHVLVTHVLAKFRKGGSRIRQFQQKLCSGYEQLTNINVPEPIARIKPFFL